MRQAISRLGASLTRRYPFLSGRGTIANSRLLRLIFPPVRADAWCLVHGRRFLAPLDDYVGRAAFYLGDLDPKLSKIAKLVVRDGDTVLDIGANLGLLTVLFSNLVGSAGRVLAFEPNPRVLERLRRTVGEPGGENVEVFPFALGSQEGELELWVPGDNLGMGSLVHNHGRTASEGVARVSVRVLDDVLAGSGVVSIRLVKIDVEGFEAHVLRGAERCLREVRPHVILFEMNDPVPPGRHEVPLMLAAADYALYSITKSYTRLRFEEVDLKSEQRPGSHDYIAIAPGPPRAEVMASLGIAAVR